MNTDPCDSLLQDYISVNKEFINYMESMRGVDAGVSFDLMLEMERLDAKQISAKV